MNDLIEKRLRTLELLTRATELENIAWEHDAGTDPLFLSEPTALYYSTHSKTLIDIGQFTKDTPNGPRQTVFIRILTKDGNEIDFFDEYDFGPAHRNKFTYLLERVSRNVKGIDKSYDSLLKELTSKADEIPF